MESSQVLQIPQSVEDCVYLMRSYVYVDKFYGEAHIREITSYFAPGFVLGVLAQIPFTHNIVKSYIEDVHNGYVGETVVSSLHLQEMERNQFINDQFIFYPFTGDDWNFILSGLLSTIVKCIYNYDAPNQYDCVSSIANMIGMPPMKLVLPDAFQFIMQSAFASAPELQHRMMLAIVRNEKPRKGVGTWTLIKRFIAMQVNNYRLKTFFAIGAWYKCHQKSLAHAESEIREEMAVYQQCVDQMRQIAGRKYDVGAFRVLNPHSTLPYLRQFPASAYCAVEWKKKTDAKWANRKYQDRFGIDTVAYDKLLEIPVKFTAKRPLTDEEFETIAAKRMRFYTDDDNEYQQYQDDNQQYQNDNQQYQDDNQQYQEYNQQYQDEIY